jgi:hypothetical protein
LIKEITIPVYGTIFEGLSDCSRQGIQSVGFQKKRKLNDGSEAMAILSLEASNDIRPRTSFEYNVEDAREWVLYD